MDDLVSRLDLLMALINDMRVDYDDLARNIDSLEALVNDRSIGEAIGRSFFTSEDAARDSLENVGKDGDELPKVFYNRQFITFAEKMPWKGKVKRAFVRVCIDEDGISIQTENRVQPYGKKRFSDEFVCFTQRYSWGNAPEIFMNPPQKYPGGFVGIRMDISGTCEVRFGDDAPVRCSNHTYVWLSNHEVLRDISKAVCTAVLYWAQKKQMTADKVVPEEQKLGVVDDILADAVGKYEDARDAFREYRREFNCDRHR